jgi:protease-4
MLQSALASGRKGLGRGLAFFGAGAVLSSAALAVTRWQAARADRQLPLEYVLELPLDRLHVVECLDPSPLALLRGDTNQVDFTQQNDCCAHSS